MTTYSSLQDVIDQVVRPLLGDYVDDYDLHDAATALTRWHGNRLELYPWADPDSDEYDQERVSRALARCDILLRGQKALRQLADQLDPDPPTSHPAETLMAVHDARILLDRLEQDAIRILRRQGKSWQDIATLLGVTRQAAHERFRHLDDE